MAFGIVFLSFTVLVGAYTNLDEPAFVNQIVGVENSSVILPCSTYSSVSQHARIQLVLWYRQDDPSGRPVFSQDARRHGMSSAKTFSADPPMGFGNRATSVDKGLRIDKLREKDAALYRCRIDFSNAPTANYLVNLTIVLPPKSMDILDASEGNDGPSTQRALQEGDRMHIMCRVIGGRPKPEVSWSLDGRVIDSTYESLSTDTTVNLLSTMPPLARHHQGKQLACVAKNTELAPPITKFIIIELLLRPLWTRVSSPERILVSGQPVIFECRSGGSRPPARLSWWRGGQQVNEASFNYSSSADGESLSVVRLSPEPEDDERFLECRAENLAISDSVVSDRWKMEVQFPVQAELRPGAHVHLNSLREGDDAFLECQVKGNPHPTQVKWLHNGVPLVPVRSAGVLRSQFVLVMQRISRNSAGSYACFVDNFLGNSTSNSIHIIVKHAPVCATSSVLEVHATVGHNATLECPLTTNPAVLTVRWHHVQTTATATLVPYPHTFSFIRHLAFNNVRRADLGRYQCWGRNAVGEQAQPCQIDLIAPGGPSKPVNCTAELQNSQLLVSCIPGEPSGLEENFFLEILSIPEGKLRSNLSAPWAPLLNWTIPWPPDPADSTMIRWNSDIFEVRIKAVSSQGFGEPFVVYYPPSTPKVPLAEASNTLDEPLLTTVFSAVAAFLFCISCLVILVLVARRRKFTQLRREVQAARKRVADTPIVRTPLPKPKVKKNKHDVDTDTPLVENFKRHTLAPSHPTKSLEVGLDQVRNERKTGNTPNRRNDSTGNLMRVKSLESCI